MGIDTYGTYSWILSPLFLIINQGSMEIKGSRAVLRALEKKWCLCATHGVRLLSLLHTLCIPPFLLFLRGVIGKKRQGKAGSERTDGPNAEKTVKTGGWKQRSSCWEPAKLGNALEPACAALQGQRNQLRFMLWPCMRAEGITKSLGSQAEQNPQQIPPCQKAFIFRQVSSLHFYATLKT